jgi:hypothetical protein
MNRELSKNQAESLLICWLRIWVKNCEFTIAKWLDLLLLVH